VVRLWWTTARGPFGLLEVVNAWPSPQRVVLCSARRGDRTRTRRAEAVLRFRLCNPRAPFAVVAGGHVDDP